jgi:hypothetical protein
MQEKDEKMYKERKRKGRWLIQGKKTVQEG